MIVQSKAILVSKINYADSDLIIRVFTEEKGMISLLIRGARKSKKYKTAFFLPLSVLDLILDLNEKRELQYPKEISLALALKDLHFDVQKASLSFFISEIINKSIRETETDRDLFSFLVESIVFLDHSQKPIYNFHLGFMVKLAAFLGFGFSEYFVDNQNDIVIDGMQLNPKMVENLRRLIHLNWDDLHSLSLNNVERAEMLDQLINYYYYHLDGMVKIKSRDVLAEFFKV